MEELLRIPSEIRVITQDDIYKAMEPITAVLDSHKGNINHTQLNVPYSTAHEAYLLCHPRISQYTQRTLPNCSQYHEHKELCYRRAAH